VFHLQASQGNRLLTLTIEKEQAAALAESITSMLEEIHKQHERTTNAPRGTLDLELHEPILPAFRVGQMGLGYDSDNDLIVLVLNELLPEGASEEPRVARLAATRERMMALADHAMVVVTSGRPMCGNCGRPIDPDGHFCPNSNGHRKPVPWG
jgi:uncharacterized repeat protein (TIGR03847 family)